MKNSYSLKILGLVAWVASVSSLGFAGHEVGNGVDQKHPSLQSAWFIGVNKVIRYCTVVAADFGASEEVIDREVATALDTWEAYYLPRKGTPPENWAEAQIVTQYRKIKACDGSEDLTFFFGAYDAKTVHHKEQFVNPAGFSIRTRSDSVSGWSKGFVWLAKSGSAIPEMNFPNWSDAANLQGVLLHEIGHIYGNDHVKGTIMDDTDLFYLVALGREMEPGYDKILRSIDHYRQLALCSECSVVWRGRLGRHLKDEYGDEDLEKNAHRSRAVFKLLTGREAEGLVTATVYSRNVSKEMSFIVTDENGSYEFAIDYSPLGQKERTLTGKRSTDLRRSFAPLVGTAFNVFLERWDENKKPYEMVFLAQSSYAWVEYAELTAVGGKKLFLILENSLGGPRGEGPMTIKFVDNGKVEYLFWMSFLHEGNRELPRFGG